MSTTTRIAVCLIAAVAGACLQLDRGIDIPPASISGRAVRAEDPSTPVPFARIGIGARFTLADAEGAFILRDVPIGRYDLDFNNIGDIGDTERRRTSSRSLLVGSALDNRPEFVLLGTVPLEVTGDLQGSVLVRDPAGGNVPVRGFVDEPVIVRIFASTRCLSCDAGENVLRGIASQVDADPDTGDFSLDFPAEPMSVQAVAYLPTLDPRPQGTALGTDRVVLGDRVVGISAAVAVTDVAEGAALVFDSIDVVGASPVGEVTIRFNQLVPTGTTVIARPSGQSADCAATVAGEQRVTTATAGNTLTIADVPVGVWRFIECTANVGASDEVLVTPEGTNVLLQLVGPTCGTRGTLRNDCDGDGVPGLLDAELDACVASCEDSNDRCVVPGQGSFDCEDDGDGFVDVVETGCYGSEFGGDLDADGLCDSVDAYPTCFENVPAVCEVAGEGEGEGEGEGAAEGEGEIGEGEGEPPLVLCEDEAIPARYEVIVSDDTYVQLPTPVIAIEQRRPFDRQLVIMVTDNAANEADGLLFAALVRGEPAPLQSIPWQSLGGLDFQQGAMAFVTDPDPDIQRAVLFHSGSNTLLVPLESNPLAVVMDAPSRNGHDLLVLAGNAFAVGGTRDGVLEGSIDRIHPSFGSTGQSLQQPRRGQLAITMATTAAVDVGFVIGGIEGGGGRLSSVESLSMGPGDNGPTLSVMTPLQVARGHAKGVLLADGRVVVVGGDVDGRTWEIWDPAGARSEGPFLLLVPRISGHTAVELSMGGVLVAGGTDAASAAAEVLNTSTGCTSPVNTSTPLLRRVGGVAFSTQAGEAFLIGGTDGAGSPIPVERLDFKTQVPITADGCSRAVTSNDGSWLFARCDLDGVRLLVPDVTGAAITRAADATDIVLLDLGTKRNLCLSCAGNLAQGAGLAGEDVATDGKAVAFTSNGDFGSVLMTDGTPDDGDPFYTYVAYAEDAVAGERFVTIVSTNSDTGAIPSVSAPVGLVGDGDQLHVAFGIERDFNGTLRTLVSLSNVQRSDPVLGDSPNAFGSDSVSAFPLTRFALSVGLSFFGGNVVPVVAFTTFLRIAPSGVWYAEDPNENDRGLLLGNLGQDGIQARCLRMHTSSDGNAAVCIAEGGEVITMKLGQGARLLDQTAACSSMGCPTAEVEQRFDEGFELVPIVVYENSAGTTSIFAPIRRLANGGETGSETIIVDGGAPSLNQGGTIVTTIQGGTILRYTIDDHVSALLAP
jgi:hypothetical protein